VLRTVVLLLLLAQPLAAQEGARLRLSAAPLSGPLRLDGALTESAWATADSIANLTQTEPNEGSPPSTRTVVRVLVTRDALIFGIRADDPDPRSITSFARERDANLSNEDNIRLVLDTYLDGRSGYVFAVNPNGARFDALIASQGEGENAQWDAVWQAATVRTETGWSAEIRIPVKSLLFRHGLSEWGFNVQRRIQRLQETDRWSSPDRDVKINMMSRSGLLTDLPVFDLGIGLSVRPSLTSEAGKPAPGARVRTDQSGSLDLTQRLGANILTSLTMRTDFAETDVDSRRTNLTRFPLFFPEKRTFFLEGSDLFDFGLGLGSSSGGGDFIPFFTRRIGLLDSREVPIDAGLKVNGRQGGTAFGALIVRTAELDTLSTAQTMGVLRIRQNVLRESSVGVIATAGDPLGMEQSWLTGADLTLQTSHFRGDKNLLLGLWGVALGRGEGSESPHAFGGKLDYPNDLFDLALVYKRIDDNFNPSLGFVPRTGVQIANLNITFQPRPRRPIFGLHVRQMFNEFENTLVTDLSGNWQSYRVFIAPVNWRLESGDRFEFNVVPVGERLTEPFEIEDAVEIPTGTYHWLRYRLEAGLASKRRLSGQLTWWFGNFYTGLLDELSLTASWKPSSLFVLELNGTRNVGRLEQGNFTQNVVGTRARLNISPDLQLNTYVQYDNQSNSVGANARVRWTFAPSGDLFMVYNHNLNELKDALNRHLNWQFSSNQLLLKVQYALRY
jgi:hypothetical protein